MVHTAIIWHGGCPTGADKAAVEFAESFGVFGIQCVPFPADWDTHGNAAGPVRNKAMMQAAARKQTIQGGSHLVEVLAFPCATADNRGTLNAIYEAIGAKLNVTIKWV